MIWGYFKTFTLAIAAYWVIRFFVLGADAARRIDPWAVRLFVPVMLWSLAWGALLLWGGGLLTAAGITGSAALWIGLAVFFGNFLLEISLSLWKVGAALGNARLTFTRSLRLVGPQLPWSLAFSLLAILPVMVAHYALGLGAIGRPPALAMSLLVLDSLLVGYLAVVIVGTMFVIARRTAAKAGISLVPEQGEGSGSAPVGAAAA